MEYVSKLAFQACGRPTKKYILVLSALVSVAPSVSDSRNCFALKILNLSEIIAAIEFSYDLYAPKLFIFIQLKLNGVGQFPRHLLNCWFPSQNCIHRMKMRKLMYMKLLLQWIQIGILRMGN